MSQGKILSLHEKLQIGVRIDELEKQGKYEEAQRVRMTVPIPAYLVKFYKEHLGLEALLNSGLNLSEAEAELGAEYFTK
jgi:hypothetical protein